MRAAKVTVKVSQDPVQDSRPGRNGASSPVPTGSPGLLPDARIIWAPGGPLSRAIGVIVVWAVTGPIFHYSDTWQLVINTGTTIVTFLMVFLIQNTQNRDAGAIHLKLNELIHAVDKAKNKMIDVENLSELELDELARTYEKIRTSAEERHQARQTHVALERMTLGGCRMARYTSASPAGDIKAGAASFTLTNCRSGESLSLPHEGSTPSSSMDRSTHCKGRRASSNGTRDARRLHLFRQGFPLYNPHASPAECRRGAGKLLCPGVCCALEPSLDPFCGSFRPISASSPSGLSISLPCCPGLTNRRPSLRATTMNV